MADTPDPVDVHVGNTIRALRKRAGISQDRLARALGLTFQQIQKYESARNRCSASALSRIAHFMNAPIGGFFPAVDEAGVVAGLGPADKLAAAAGGLDLAEAYLSLPPHARTALLRVAAAMHDGHAEEPGAAYVTGGDEEPRRRVA